MCSLTWPQVLFQRQCAQARLPRTWGSAGLPGLCGFPSHSPLPCSPRAHEKQTLVSGGRACRSHCLLIIERPTERSEECRVVSGRPDPSFPGFLLSWGAGSTPRRGRPAGLLRVGRAQAAGAAFCREALHLPCRARGLISAVLLLPMAVTTLGHQACGPVVPALTRGRKFADWPLSLCFSQIMVPKSNLTKDQRDKQLCSGPRPPHEQVCSGPGGDFTEGQLQLSFEYWIGSDFLLLVPWTWKAVPVTGQVAPHVHTAPAFGARGPRLLSWVPTSVVACPKDAFLPGA